MSEWYKKVGVLVALILGLGLGFVAVRGSMDLETANEIASGLSVLPFSDWLLRLLKGMVHIDPAYVIQVQNPWFTSLLILFVQTLIQSPILLLLNNAMGPVLFRTNANEYSVVGDWSASRTKDKILRRLGKLVLVIILVPLIAFLAGWMISTAQEWVGKRPTWLQVIIYILVFLLVVALACLPIWMHPRGFSYGVFLASAAQRIIYVLITNFLIIAVVSILVAGSSGWHFMLALLILLAWMTIYSDTDGFLAHKLVSAR